MGDIVKSLRNLEFPECTKGALKFLATSLSSTSAGDGKYISDVCQDYILFRKGSHRKQLNAIQELQLLELLCEFLEGLQDGVRIAAFAFIFGGRVNSSKVELLTKLVSMGISVHSKAVLDSAADWMQDHGSDSEQVLTVTKTLVQDHCRLYPDMSSAFKTLPTICPLLACNIMCAVTSVYSYNAKDQAPPPLLVKYVTQWISDDPSLCATSVLTFSSPHMMREGCERHCPVAGLLKWCTAGPLVEDVPNRGNSCLSPDSLDDNSILTVFSKLHLALLQTLLDFSHEHCTLLTLRSVESLVKNFQEVCKSVSCAPDGQLALFSVERLGQAIQLSLSSGNLRCSKSELSKAVKVLLPNRLLDIVLSQLDRQSATPMDLS